MAARDLLRAYDLQTTLEDLLGFDADSEVQGGLDEALSPPAPCVMLTEVAATKAIEMLRTRTAETVAFAVAVEAWRGQKHKDIDTCIACKTDRDLLTAIEKFLGVAHG